jgi:predicted DNA-binding transcriptional regulator YafY
MGMNMQINRLFEIIMMLLNKETITAKELAEHFGVSTRTIYRDIDTLSLSNIPIYTNKGSGGGISLLPEFTINKSLLSEKEQGNIIAALHSLKAAKYSEVDTVITKLGAIFKNSNNYNWVEVDFSHWGSDSEEKNKFDNLKSAILLRRVVEFDYVSSYGEKTKREVKPIKLVFKDTAWYLYGFCEGKQDNRIFRISRIRGLIVKEISFEPLNLIDVSIEQKKPDNKEIITIRLKFAPEVTYRVYDDSNYEDIKHNEDGTIEATISFPKGEWVYGYILSFGHLVEVLEPADLREEIKERLHLALNIYT